MLDATISLARGVHVGALLLCFGTLTLIAAIAELRDAPQLRSVLHRLVRVATAFALVSGLAWLVLETAVIAGTGGVIATVHALPVVALQTQFGWWCTLRCLVLLVLLPLPFARRGGRAVALVLAAVALGVQPFMGHAGAIGGSAGAQLIVSEVLHLLAAGAWLGGLLPLFIAVGMLPHEAAARVCRGFTPIGLAAVTLLAGTAILQVAALVGGLPGLFGTAYGHVALLKLGVFLLLLILAATNRLMLTERMAQGRARSAMRLSIAAEMALGVLVVLLAGYLASLTPGTHEQPVWPFAWRLDLDAFADPALRPALLRAVAMLAVAGALAVAGIAWRRVRWFAMSAACVLLVLTIPDFGPLLSEAYPTSFITSPTEFAATAVAHGARVFSANCAMCHGTDARGHGPAADSLVLPPADLTAEHFWGHSDGDLYWFVSHGFSTPDGVVVMPGFAGTLSSEAIWDVIDYLRARNAGATLRRTGKWLHPVPVPQFDAACPDGRTVDLDDLRGHVLRFIAVAGDEQRLPVPTADAEVTTLILSRHRLAEPNGSACVTREPEAWTAFATVLGVAPEALVGTQILADRDAWLRAAWRPGDPGDWTDPKQLAGQIADIRAHPLTLRAGGAHAHQH